MKAQILNLVRQMVQLKLEMASHWTAVQKCLAAENADDAISLLNAYFSLRVKLEGVESNLQGVLRGYFSDK